MELNCISRDEVYLDGRRLDIKKSLKHINHSPTGFMWGYGGSGPAQLALAVMLEMVGQPSKDGKHYQDFKFDVLARLPQKPCALEMDFIGWLSGDKDYRFEVRELDFDPTNLKGEDELRSCTSGFGDRCTQATSSDCDCQCGGANHGSQTSLFSGRVKQDLEIGLGV